MREDLVIRGPLYFHLTDDGELYPTTPSEVGARAATHTLYWFSTDFASYTAVMVTGEHGYPSDPVIAEAEFQLYGIEAGVTR